MIYEQKFSIDYNFSIKETEEIFSLDNLTIFNILPDIETRCFFCIEEVIVDKNPSLLKDIFSYFSCHYRNIKLVEDFYIKSGGEKIKNNVEEVFSLINKMQCNQICRHSYILIIGGGAFLDFVGFACTIFHRGIKHIRIPTTMLSQCDGGLGVKNAINYQGNKNCLGTFAPPTAIINDYIFLKTLPKKILISGLSEIIKVCLVKDKGDFSFIENNIEKINAIDWLTIKKLIKISAIHHSKHIGTSGDPFERGSSRPLDFGHWAAHYLETMSGYSVFHGEAVAIGIALDVYYSCAVGLLSETNRDRILRVLKNLHFSLYTPLMEKRNKEGGLEIFEGIEFFREHLGGNLTVLMLKDIGKGIDVHFLDKQIFVEAINYLKSYS